MDPVLEAVDLLLGDPAGNSDGSEAERALWHAKNEALAMIVGNLCLGWDNPRIPDHLRAYDRELLKRINQHCGWTMQ